MLFQRALHKLVIHFYNYSIVCMCGLNASRSYHLRCVNFRVNMSQDDNEPQRFTIEEEQTRQYRRFNAQGTQLTVRLLPPPEGEDPNPMSHFVDSVTELFVHALRDLEDSDMVGITISNEVEVKDRAIGISFRRKDQITGDVIWSVFEKVAQSYAGFNAVDTLLMTVLSVKMPTGHGGGIATNGRPLELMARLKKVSYKSKLKVTVWLMPWL